MKMSKKQYQSYVDKKTPNSKTGINVLKSFLMGGIICTIGQCLTNLFSYLGASQENAPAYTSIALVFLGALLTGLGIYDDLAAIGCAGTLIPITGFANSVVSPAMEFKNEGHVTGISAKIFTIAGPVLLFGAMAATAYGIIYYLLYLWG